MHDGCLKKGKNKGESRNNQEKMAKAKLKHGLPQMKAHKFLVIGPCMNIWKLLEFETKLYVNEGISIEYNQYLGHFYKISRTMSTQFDQNQSWDPYYVQPGSERMFTENDSYIQPNSDDDQYLEDEHMIKQDHSDLQETHNDNSNRQAVAPRRKRRISKKTNQTIPKRRDGNSIASNACRDFQNFVKISLKFKKKVCQPFLQWIKTNKIISQIWGFDAMCIYLLFLRDHSKTLDKQDYRSILKRFQEKLQVTLQFYEDSGSINKIICYQLHVTEYLKTEFHFASIKDFLKDGTRHFDGIVKKRGQTQQDCIKKLRKIYSGLNSQGRKFESDLETTVMDNELETTNQKDNSVL